MKRFIAKYLLFIYNNYIDTEDFGDYKKRFVPVIKMVNFVRKIYIWVGSVVFFPIFVLVMFMTEFIETNKKIIFNKR